MITLYQREVSCIYSWFPSSRGWLITIQLSTGFLIILGEKETKKKKEGEITDYLASYFSVRLILIVNHVVNTRDGGLIV